MNDNFEANAELSKKRISYETCSWEHTASVHLAGQPRRLLFGAKTARKSISGSCFKYGRKSPQLQTQHCKTSCKSSLLSEIRISKFQHRSSTSFFFSRRTAEAFQALREEARSKSVLPSEILPISWSPEITHTLPSLRKSVFDP